MNVGSITIFIVSNFSDGMIVSTSVFQSSANEHQPGSIIIIVVTVTGNVKFINMCDDLFQGIIPYL